MTTLPPTIILDMREACGEFRTGLQREISFTDAEYRSAMLKIFEGAFTSKMGRNFARYYALHRLIGNDANSAQRERMLMNMCATRLFNTLANKLQVAGIDDTTLYHYRFDKAVNDGIVVLIRR